MRQMCIVIVACDVCVLRMSCEVWPADDRNYFARQFLASSNRGDIYVTILG